MSKKVIVSIVVILIIVAISLVWRQGMPKQPQKYSGPVEKITIGFPLRGAELELLNFVAEDKGYFKDQGLDVLIKDEPDEVASGKDLKEGRIDVAGFADYSFALQSFDTQSSKIIATIDKSTFLTIIGRKDKGLTNPSDLKGKKVGVVQKTVSEYAFHQFLLDHGIPAKDVEIVPVPGANIISAVTNGEVDAVSAALPVEYLINKSLKAGTISWPTLGENPFYWLLTVTQDTLTKRPDLVKRILRALVTSEDFVRKNPQKAREIVARRYDFTNDYYDFVWPKHNWRVSLDQSLLLTLENQARWIIENKLTDKTQVPNYLNFIYFDGLEKVKPEAITIIR